MEFAYSHISLKFAPLGIVLVAFSVRVALLIATGLYLTNPDYETNNIATAIAAGQGFANPYSCCTGATGHLAPLFPLFSSGLLVLTGAHWGLAKALASITVVSLTWAVMPYASQTLGFTWIVGVMAGFMGAFLPLAITTELRGDWEAPYIAAALLLAATAAIRIEKSSIPRKLAGVRHGICWGALLLTFPAAVLLLPGWLWRVGRKRWGQCMPYALTLIAATASTISPYIVYAHAHTGYWFFIRDNLGLELFVSNHPDSAVLLFDNTAKVLNRYHPLQSRRACAEVQRVGEGEFEKQRLEEAIGFIEADPARFLSRTGQRALWLVFPWTADWRRNAIEWAIAGAGLAGCIIAIRLRQSVIWFLISGVSLYMLPYFLVQSSPRYRYPIWWVFVLLGMYAVRQISRQVSRHVSTYSI
jgi:hypothetical protein